MIRNRGTVLAMMMSAPEPSMTRVRVSVALHFAPFRQSASSSLSLFHLTTNEFETQTQQPLLKATFPSKNRDFILIQTYLDSNFPFL